MSKKYLLPLLFTTIIYADCSKKPVSHEVKTAIEEKNYTKAKSLFNAFKKEVKTYEEKCDQSKEMHEELNVLLLSCQDHIDDLAEDISTQEVKIDCSVLPSPSKLQKAFNTSKHEKIKRLYPEYKKSSNNYIKYCASDASYEEVYEASILCDEKYEEWKKAGH